MGIGEIWIWQGLLYVLGDIGYESEKKIKTNSYLFLVWRIYSKGQFVSGFTYLKKRFRLLPGVIGVAVGGIILSARV